MFGDPQERFANGDLTSVEYWERAYVPGSHIQPRPWRSRGDRAIIRLLQRCDIVPRGGKVVEMGCGDSYWLPYFAKRIGLTVAGIDYSPERSLHVRRLLAKWGIQGDIVCDDFRRIPKNWEGAFDLVFSAGVIEHFEDPKEIVHLFSKYLKPGGWMLTTVPNLVGLWGWLQGKIDSKILNAHNRFDLNTLRNFHESAGLRILRAEYQRWGDPGVLNLSTMKSVPRFLGQGFIQAINIPLYALESLRILPENSRIYSANIVVLAQRFKL